MQKILNILFIVVSIASLIEYYFIAGMFTGPLMICAILIVGISNCIYSAVKHKINESILYAITTLSICIGYFKLM